MNPFTKAGTLVQENSNSAFETSRRLNAITHGYGSREYLINQANYTVQYCRYLTGCVLTVLTQSWLGLCWFHCPQYLLYLMIPGLAYRNNCSADSVQKHWFITSSVILSESAMHDEKKEKKRKTEREDSFPRTSISDCLLLILKAFSTFLILLVE